MALPQGNRPVSLIEYNQKPGSAPPPVPPVLPPSGPSRWSRWRSKLASFVRRRKKPLIGVAIGAVVAGAIAAFIVIGPEIDVPVLSDIGIKPTLAELTTKAKAEPKNAGLQVELGHAQFEAGKRTLALRSYDRGLTIDKALVSGEIIDNLVSCYGKKEQDAAHTLLVKFKMVESSTGLRKFTTSPAANVRGGALITLKALSRATDTDFLNVWTLDLKSTECDVRRRAVEKLGVLGDKRALDDIRVARKKDKEETPWYRPNCLTSEADDAEKKILAKR